MLSLKPPVAVELANVFSLHVGSDTCDRSMCCIEWGMPF